ncbi:hypothetical protein DFQ03_2113 [Maribacter caenipelagi]|uniref:Uncharacterized protein n=1 Tax=Maribacter caenipelagi TaxID=1447781 RepID=A0A4R7D555_9FLAO|nr:hypothetical protein [Maribacter caenipelagi]TDS15472.1 hypothetical protein DFQ03_2113 [Maribacter caenipelagi]
MKSTNNIFRVLLLVTIYCFGIYSSANSLPFSNEVVLHQDNDSKTYFSASSKTLSPHAQQSEISVSDVAEISSQNYKLLFTSFNSQINYSELGFVARFKQYQLYANTLLIRHKKSDLIFPFHSFW